MYPEDRAIREIWKQQGTPVVLRRGGNGERPRARLPGNRGYSINDQAWLQNGRRIYPRWNFEKLYWEFPRAWFNDFVDRSLKRFGRLYVIQPFREQQKCARACMEAQGHECECQCMGANHGSGIDGSWFEVSETFATRYGSPRLACRLMTRETLKVGLANSHLSGARRWRSPYREAPCRRELS